MKTFYGILIVMLVLGVVYPVSTHAQSQRTESIAAVVNDDAVSASDVSARMKLVMISSGLPDNQDIRDKMRPQVVKALIDERLMVQEAERLGIGVAEEDIQRGFAGIASQNNMSVEQFQGVMRSQNIPYKALADQIKAQAAWSKVIQEKLRPRVKVAENEIDVSLDRLTGGQGKAQYLVSEIFLPVSKPEEEADTQQLANKLMQQLVQGKVPFQRIASQFSQAAGANQGGDLGWVQEGHLAPEIDSVLKQMKEGELSQPIRTLSGVHILLLRKKGILTEENLPTREQIHNKLGMEQLDRMQRRYLLDLKASAFIESRV